MEDQKDNRKQIWQIDYYQGVALTAAITFGAIIPFSSTGKELGANVWQAVLLSLVMGLVYCYLLSLVIKKYDGQGLIDINNSLFGNKLGKVLNLVFLLQIILAYSYYLYTLIELWQAFGKEEDTFWTIALIILVLTSFAAIMGIEAISRISMIIIFLFFIIFFLDLILVLPQIEFQRLLPLKILDINALFSTSFKLFILEFSLFPMVLIFTPYLKDAKKAGKSIYESLVLIVVYILLNTLRNCLLLGETVKLYQYPVLQALRMVEWGPVFSRLEIMGIMVIIANGLLFLMITNFIIAILGKDIFSLKKYQNIILPFFVIELIIVYFINKYQHIFLSQMIIKLLSGVFMIVLLLLIISLFKNRKLRKQKNPLKETKKEEKNLSW